MREEVKRWMSKAERDMDNAHFNLQWKKYEESCFFSQQTVEKSLKALDIEKSGSFVKSHDLVFLGKRVNVPNDILDKCRKIKPVYTESRYPDFLEGSPYTKEKTETIVNDFEEVLGWVKQKLKS